VNAQFQHDNSCRRRQADWLLVDGLRGGSGEALDWHALEPPLDFAQRGWLLAGGLHPDNVAEAAAIARPSIVDVSSGVAGPDGIVKDAAKVRAFIAAAKGSAAGGAQAAAAAPAATGGREQR